MKTTIDCIPCIISHVVHVAQKLTTDAAERRNIVAKTLTQVTQTDLDLTPPEQARAFHKIIKEVTDVNDPYRDEKDKSTDFALELLPFLREKIAAHSSPFEAMVRFVIGGNIIDYGADHNFDIASAQNRILEVLDMPLDIAAAQQFKRQLEKAKSIFYMADNCGEAVIDRLLIEEYKDKVTLGVRGEPILNDLTPREVVHSGLGFVPFTHTGDMTPGVSMRYSSKEFLEKLHSADLVIAKGQGNFETLNDYHRPIFFLLRVKCKVIGDLLNEAELGSLKIIGKNLKDI